MAKDPTVKLKIRAHYESHNLTFKELFEHFKDYDVSQKTMEYWARVEEWQKGKYQDIATATDDIVANEISENIDDKIKALVRSKSVGVIKDKSAEEYFVNEVSKELVFAAVNKNFLAKEMIENLNRAKSFAIMSKGIGTNKVYHNMVTSTYTTLHGRQTNIGLVDPRVRDAGTLEAMSTEELKELIGEIDD